MEGIAVRVKPEAMQLTELDMAELRASRPKRRICDILSNAADSGGCGYAPVLGRFRSMGRRALGMSVEEAMR